MALSPDRWQEVRAVFEQVVGRLPSEWSTLLDELCEGAPDVREEVEALLHHHDTQSLSPAPVGPTEELTPSVSGPGRLGRFEIVRTLGRGGYGDVYLALDKERGHQVALKSLRKLDARAILGFKKGFRLLKEIRHPNLVQMYDLVSDGQSFYLGMELLDGVDLLTFIAARPSEAISAIAQLAAGLQALHTAGVLHRDVKPSNVWVTAAGRAVLLDFGMTQEIDVPFASVSGAIFGTPLYIAPELLVGGTPGPASDWYAVGVILHQWLTGEPPFKGSAIDILAMKRERSAAAPARNLPDAPAEIVALCTGLLDRDPARRPDGASIIATLGTPEHQPPVTELQQSELLTGRSAQLERVAAAFEHSRREGTVAWIRGASGSGKTSLVRHFLKELRRSGRDVVTLEGRCTVSEFLPYKAVDGLVDDLARYLASLPAGDMGAILPRNAELLARLFPVMSRVTARLAPDRMASRFKDDVEVRRRAFRALRELFDRLAERKRVVLFIDDAQWGDLDSVSLISELMAPPDTPPLLWLIAYREEETTTSAFLGEMLSRPFLATLRQEEVQVDRLSRQDAESLAADLFRRAGRSPEEALVRTIAAESGGSPLFLNQLVQHWSESSTRHPEKGVTLDEVLVSRADRLPRGPRELLELVIASERRLEMSVALRAKRESDQSSGEIERLVGERLIRVSSSAGVDALEVFHDRIRETLLPRIPLERVQSLHARLGIALEEEGGVDPERLMHHLELGGNREKAAVYAERAAQAAASSLTFRRAAELYRKLLEWGEHSPERALALRRGLAEALSNSGRSYEAAQEYLAMARDSPPESRFELEQLAAEHCLRSGHVSEGVALIRALCVSVGMRFPVGAFRSLLMALWQRARVRLRGLPSDADVREGPLPKSTENQLNLCRSAGTGIGLVDAVLGAVFHSRFYLLAMRSGSARHIGMALAMEAAYSAFSGESTRARSGRVYERFESFASKIDDPFVRGFGLAMRGTMSWLLGDFRQTGDLNREALAVFEAGGVGFGWERVTAQIHRIGSMTMTGEWHRIAAEFPALLEEAASRGDLYAHVGLRLMPYPYFVRLGADEPDRARSEISDALSAWTPEGFHIQHCDAMFGLADVALYEGRGWEALEILESQREGLRRSRLLSAQLTRAFFLALRGRAALTALAAEGGPESGREQARARLDRDIQRLQRETAPWIRGWHRLLAAGRHSLDGRLEEAAGVLASAELELERADLHAFGAACRWRRGALAQGVDGRKLQADAESWMSERGIRAPARLTDMFVPGRWR